MDWEIRTAALLLCLTVLLATIQHGDAERKIVCYYTNWSVYRPGTAKFSPQNINPYLCTHLIYAFGGFTKDNTLKPFDKYQDIEKGGYAKFTGLKTYNKNLKTMLAIGGWNEGSSRFSPMVADPARRREFVKNSVKFLRLNHFDGLDLDWEYPAFRDGGKPRDKDNYANLVQELREEFEREASKTGRPRLLLSMAMPAGIEYIDKGYDVPRLNEYLDFINLLSYDYHSAYEPAVNHHSPLYPLEEDNEYNYDTELTIDYTINHLVKQGASPEKVILGIPTYGRSYTLFNEDATDLGSPADGPGVEGDATREKGYLAYYEICEGIAESDEWEVVQPNPNAMGPYAIKGNQWVGYDDEDIVRLKAKYVNEKNLGGIMFWSIDNDDFRGKCHGRAYPLIEAAKEALLTANTKTTAQKSKSVGIRKKNRSQGLQSNTIGRKLGSSSRRSTTTATPTPRKRASSPRPRYQTITRTRPSDEEEYEEDEEEEEGKEVDRRSYEPSDEERSEGGNVVRTLDKNERPRSKPKGRTKGRSSSSRNRRKQSRRKEKKESEEESLSNKLTTPEPPTTPDPGSDFKCEDEGFFSHPRDCKKYFWCLDSGPGGLGVVAHQFTCPSGLVFNKAADSCDYPRNVICPKAKTSQSAVSTTRAPITAATSRTTYLHATTKRTTTVKASSEEEYDSYEDEDEIEDEEELEEEEEVEEEVKRPPPKATTTPKPLLYKTINRSRPTTTTTTTSTTAKPERAELDKVVDSEDEEDPRVIKDLIDLIKKAGGIEQLEKQLLFQDKSSDTTADSEQVTPATISRTLYERVLSRQANRIAAGQRPQSSGKTNYANGPGGAQFEGLDEVPEVKSIRRTQKPQYVTIERPKASTKEPPVEDEEDEEEEEFDSDNTDVASSEDRTISNPFLRSSTQRATPNYVNIRRARPSTTTSRTDNDVEEKEEEVEVERPARRRRPFTSKSRDDEANSDSAEPARKRISSTRNTEGSKNAGHTGEADSPSYDGSEETPTTKSRYVSIHRFRSTTSRSSDETQSTEPSRDEATLETITESIGSIQASEAPETSTIGTTATTASTSTASSELPTQTIDAILHTESTESASTVSSILEGSSTVEPVRLVEDSATEILLTTAPASSSETVSLGPSSTSNPGSTVEIVSESVSTTLAAATVFQPRPFGFPRRNRPVVTGDATTTPLAPSSNEPSKPKIASLEAIRLPTLKELVGYPAYDYTTASSPVRLNLLHALTSNDVSLQNVVDTDFSPRENDANFLSKDTDDRVRQSHDLVLSRILDKSDRGSDSVISKLTDEKESGSIYGERITDENNVENNFAGMEEGEDPRSKRRKTRIDHAGSSSSTIKPTTMRGIPLASLTPSPISRGFYVTKGNNEATSSTKTMPAKVTESNASLPTDAANTDKASWQLENDVKSTTVTDEKNEELYAFDMKTTTEIPDEQRDSDKNSIDSSTPAMTTLEDGVEDTALMYSTIGKEYLENSSTTTDSAATLLSQATASPVNKLLGETAREVPNVNIEVKRRRTTTEKTVSYNDATASVAGRGRSRSRNRGRGRIRFRSRTEIPRREETIDQIVKKERYYVPRTRTSVTSSSTISTSPSATILETTVKHTDATEPEVTETLSQITSSTTVPPKFTESSVTPTVDVTSIASTSSRNFVSSSTTELTTDATTLPSGSSTDVTTEFSTETSSTSGSTYVTTESSTDARATIEFTSENAFSTFTTVALSEETRGASSTRSKTTESVATEGTPVTSHLSVTTLKTDDFPSDVTSDLRTDIAPTTIHKLTASESTAVPTFPSTLESSTIPVSMTTYKSSNVTHTVSSSSLSSIVPATSSFEVLTTPQLSSTAVTPAIVTTMVATKSDSRAENLAEISENNGTETTSVIPEERTYKEKSETVIVDETTSSSNATKEIDDPVDEKPERGDQETKPTTLLASFTALPSSTTRTPSTENKIARRRQRIRPVASSYEFGWKTSRRTNVHRRVKIRPPNGTVEEVGRAQNAEERDQHPRRRVVVYRGRKRRPNDRNESPEKEISSTQDQERTDVQESGSEGRKIAKDKEANEKLVWEEREKEERPQDPLWVQENTERPVTEVDAQKNGSSSLRKPGIGTSSRLRKPSTPPSMAQNRTTNTNHRKTRPVVASNDDKQGAKVTTGVTEQTEKEIERRTEVSDQSIRAQELAVTLADPPSPQASGTGRLPLRDALRRKISTTIAPRTDATTSRTTRPRQTGLQRSRQRPKAKDSPPQNVTTRPRRPQVIDYDYYEDEEEPVVGKSTFNGKLVLTSKGTVRCLDQGNFPHPYSCKKFITCARMVNGQVIGAEYTCPDKLSFDPVGGICNWSAGLGCKE